MRTKRSSAEVFQVRVDESSNRVVIPPALLERTEWITGSSPIEVWLLIESPGRCRLICAQDLEKSPALTSLRATITATEEELPNDPLDFEDSEFAVLPNRLLQTQLTPPPPAWRLSVPRILTELMHIAGENKTVVFLLSKGYLEIWSVSALTGAFGRPLKDILNGL